MRAASSARIVVRARVVVRAQRGAGSRGVVLGMVCVGAVRRDARAVRMRTVRCGPVRGLVRRGLVLARAIRGGLVPCRAARRGAATARVAWCGAAIARVAWPSAVWCGAAIARMAWPSAVRLLRAWPGLVRCGAATARVAWPSAVWCGVVRCGYCAHGLA